MSRIYLASSWRNEDQPDYVTWLRGHGHEVYDFRNPPSGDGGFAWAKIDEDWEQWGVAMYRDALAHPYAAEGFASDLEGMEWADTCVLLLPCGRSAHAEAGWMAGQGKRVIVHVTSNQTEPELMYRLFDGLTMNPTELRETLGSPLLDSE